MDRKKFSCLKIIVVVLYHTKIMQGIMIVKEGNPFHRTKHRDNMEQNG